MILPGHIYLRKITLLSIN